MGVRRIPSPEPGTKFNRLTVIAEIASGEPPIRKVLCQCSCGNKKVIALKHVVGGQSKSCGCLVRELGSARATHGMSNTSEYYTWNHIKKRCLSIDDPRYAQYGARGIKICDRWLESFQNFIDDMGLKPTPQHSIDRIDNNGNYEPGNCRWATEEEQQRNKNNNVLLTHDGVTMHAVDWAAKLGTRQSVLHKRLKRGWSVADTLTVPIGQRREDE